MTAVFVALLLVMVAIEWWLGRKPSDSAKLRARWGHFEGLPAVTAWIEGSASALLLYPFRFVEPNGATHEAREKLRTDGASIPRWAWWIIGHPFRGKYRESAFLHDQLCQDGVAGKCPLPSPKVHMLFRRCIRAQGGSSLKAWAMWAAVRLAGPKFEAAT